jgi:recombination protein RecA
MAEKKVKGNPLIKQRSMTDLIGELGKYKLPVTTPEPIERMPTGVMSMDICLHGGFPKGKGVMIFGDTKMGKTTLSMFMAREVLAQGKTVAWLDIENSFDPAYAQMMNFDWESYINDGKFLYFNFKEETSVAERWLDAITMMISSGKIDLIVLDSLAAIPTSAEMNSSAEKANVATLSRLLTPWVRVIVPILKKSGTTLLIINQERVVIGANVPTPNTYPGGKALSHFMAIVLQMRTPRYEYNDNKQLVRMTLRYVIRKTKVFRPPNMNQEFETRINYNSEGCELDFVGEIIVAATQLGILKDKNGGTWSKNVAFFNGTALGNGEAKVRENLQNNDELLQEITDAVIASIKEGVSNDAGPEVDEETEFSASGIYEEEEG